MSEMLATNPVYLSQQRIAECIEQAKTLAHDTLQIKVESPFLEKVARLKSFDLKLHLSLFCGSRLIEKRLVTKSSRRHQFILATFDALVQPQVSITIEVIQLKGFAAVPRFTAEIESCRYSELVSSLEEKMIWIFGSPRTGSSWLCTDILGQLPSQARPTDDTGMRPIDESGLGRLLGEFELEPEYFYRIDKLDVHCDSGPDMDSVKGKRALRDPLLFQRSLFRNYGRPEFMLGDATHSSICEMIRKMAFNHVLLHWGILDFDHAVFKAPNEGHASDLIMHALPCARMIFLLRDGRDVLRSRFSPFASRTLAETTDPYLRRTAIAYYAHQWNWHTDIVRRAYEAHNPKKRLLLTYEELRRESRDAFLRLTHFVGAELDETAIDRLIAKVRLENFPQSERGPYFPRQQGEIGGYKSYFTNDEQRLMTAIMADNLRAFGYDVSVPKLYRINDQFSQLASYFPPGFSLFEVNGVYHDAWCSERAEIMFSSSHSFSQILVEITIPEEFLFVSGSFAITLRINGVISTSLISTTLPVALIAPVTVAKDEVVTIELMCDKSLVPSAHFSNNDDLRNLSFRINRIVLEKQSN